MAKRKLTANEIKLAQIIFGDTINYDKVCITNRIPGLLKKNIGGMCTGNTLNTSKDTYCGDYDASFRKSFFIHEMTHIWQFQQSPGYLGKKLIKELASHHFNYMAKAYQYDLEDGKPFDDYGLEYNNPDFVKFAECHGAHGYRVEKSANFVSLLKNCQEKSGVHVIELPVDYSENDRILNHEIKDRSQNI